MRPAPIFFSLTPHGPRISDATLNTGQPSASTGLAPRGSFRWFGPSGWTLVTAADVNSNEWIVGLGTDSSGQSRGYGLVPQSEY